MFDQIFVKDYKVSVDVGAFQEERVDPQELCFHVTVDLNPQQTATDEVDNILSYDVLVDAIHHTLDAKRYNLLETMAENIADQILAHAQVRKVDVIIEKLGRIDGRLGVHISRQDKPVATANTVSAKAMVWDGHAPANWSGEVVLLAPSPTKARSQNERRVYCLEEDARAWNLGAEINLPVVDSKVEALSLIARGESFIRAFGKQPFDILPPLDDFSPEGILSWHTKELNLTLK